MARAPSTFRQQDGDQSGQGVSASGIARVEIDKQGRITDEKRLPDQRGHELATSSPEGVGRIMGRPMPRRGLSRVEAATYLGISPSKFDEMRKDGRIGPAKLIDSRKVFDVRILDEVFDALPEESHEEVEDWTAAV